VSFASWFPLMVGGETEPPLEADISIELVGTYTTFPS
jgi:hypothetical protein